VDTGSKTSDWDTGGKTSDMDKGRKTETGRHRQEDSRQIIHLSCCQKCERKLAEHV
jgi:hypothetical protein